MVRCLPTSALPLLLLAISLLAQLPSAAIAEFWHSLFLTWPPAQQAPAAGSCPTQFRSSSCAKLPWYGAGPVRLLTNPVAAGYVQNPISVYYCYAASTDGGGDKREQARTPRDSCSAQSTSSGRVGAARGCSAADRPRGDCGSSQAASGGRDGGPQGCSAGTRGDCGDARAEPGGRSGAPQGCGAGGGAPPAGRLQRCIAEVTNTPWGARVTFVFDPGEQAVPKAMHVSPLMDMRSTWCAGLLLLD